MSAAGSHVPRTGPVRALWLVLPPLLLMGLIWFLSSRSDLGGSSGTLGLLLRKGAHMTEFGLLALLWSRAVGGLGLARGDAARWAAAAIALVWAVTDELHQTTVPGRHGTPVDVLIDATGIALATLLARAVRRSGPARRRRAARR